MFVADERPELPAVKFVAVAQMKKRIDVIVRHNVVFARFAVNRKQNEMNFVAKEPVFQRAVKRKKRGVIFLRLWRALLKIKRKKREPFSLIGFLTLSAGK